MCSRKSLLFHKIGDNTDGISNKTSQRASISAVPLTSRDSCWSSDGRGGLVTSQLMASQLKASRLVLPAGLAGWSCRLVLPAGRAGCTVCL